MVIKEQKIKEIYSDLTIRLVNLAKIKRLVSENIKLNVNYGLKKLKDDEMLIYSLKMYNRSIKSRLRKKQKKA
jgi:hypothetical protein